MARTAARTADQEPTRDAASVLAVTSRARRQFQRERISSRWAPAVIVFARVALGTAFLSAVADRFGLWGPPGASNAAWGNFTRFIEYTATVNSFLPAAVAPLLAWMATAAEAVLGVALLAGVRLRITAFASGVLLLAFATAMTLSLGIKKPVDFSVFSASAAAFLLVMAEARRDGRRR